MQRLCVLTISGVLNTLKSDKFLISMFYIAFQIDYDGESKLFEKDCQSFMNNFVREIFSSK